MAYMVLWTSYHHQRAIMSDYLLFHNVTHWSLFICLWDNCMKLLFYTILSEDIFTLSHSLMYFDFYLLFKPPLVCHWFMQRLSFLSDDSQDILLHVFSQVPTQCLGLCSRCFSTGVTLCFWILPILFIQSSTYGPIFCIISFLFTFVYFTYILSNQLLMTKVLLWSAIYHHPDPKLMALYVF